jgi:hypothetical protein
MLGNHGQSDRSRAPENLHLVNMATSFSSSLLRQNCSLSKDSVWVYGGDDFAA